MSETVQELSYQVILDRIENISRELEELRQLFLRLSTPNAPDDITNELLGSLGSDPIEAYDFSLDWQRFGS